MAWAKINKKDIAAAMNKPGDWKAFGAEAGKWWRSLTQPERDSYKNIPDTKPDNHVKGDTEPPTDCRKPANSLDDSEAEEFPEEEC